jgi:hypothetical protein
MTKTVTNCDMRLKPQQTGNVTQRRFRPTGSCLFFGNPSILKVLVNCKRKRTVMKRVAHEEPIKTKGD